MSNFVPDTPLIEQFQNPSMVELKKSGGKMVWHYLGHDLDGYKEFAQTVLRNGATFFDIATSEVCGSHVELLDQAQAELTLAFYHMLKDGHKYVKYSEEFPRVDTKQARGFTTNYNYLVQFGLLDKRSYDGSVKYHLTNLGIGFACGQSPSPRQVINMRSRVLSKYGQVYLQELIPGFGYRTHRWWEKV